MRRPRALWRQRALDHHAMPQIGALSHQLLRLVACGFLSAVSGRTERGGRNNAELERSIAHVVSPSQSPRSRVMWVMGGMGRGHALGRRISIDGREHGIQLLSKPHPLELSGPHLPWLARRHAGAVIQGSLRARAGQFSRHIRYVHRTVCDTGMATKGAQIFGRHVNRSICRLSRHILHGPAQDPLRSQLPPPSQHAW